MLQFTTSNTKEVRDNTLVINNAREYKLTDNEATRVIEFIEQIFGNVSKQPITRTQPRTYEHTNDEYNDFVFTNDANLVRYTHKDGSYVYEKSIRQTLNARLKAADATYNKDLKAWVFLKGSKRDIKTATAFCLANNQIPLVPEEINMIIDRWNKKEAKRAEKANR